MRLPTGHLGDPTETHSEEEHSCEYCEDTGAGVPSGSPRSRDLNIGGQMLLLDFTHDRVDGSLKYRVDGMVLQPIALRKSRSIDWKNTYMWDSSEVSSMYYNALWLEMFYRQ